eukprot:GILK01001039.1.p1 GENE.GILK01001039.1~~GILK01001039.1.p1  ORF type:complete len:302 (-),score=7.18 GILK01001039.1:412-1293(-)
MALFRRLVPFASQTRAFAFSHPVVLGPCVRVIPLTQRVAFSSSAARASNVVQSGPVVPGQILPVPLIEKNWWSLPAVGLHAKLTAPVLGLNSDISETIELNSEVFGVPLRRDILHNVVVYQRNNKRQPIAHSKTKAEVAGSGKKPWKQKGTGRARVGYRRNPIWRGGGAAHGPRNTVNFSQSLPKKVRTLGLKVALSAKYAEGLLTVVDQASLAEPKTKILDSLLTAKDLHNSVIMHGDNDMNSNFKLASRNIPDLTILSYRAANVLSILKHKRLVITKEGVRQLEAEILRRK